jgi:hypothetical protein
MAKATIITFLLAGILAFSANAIAQQQTKPGEHDHHDHSGHSMSHDSGHATDHEGEHTIDHSGDHDMQHDGHPIDHSDHSVDHGDGHHHTDHDHIMDHEGGMIMGQNLDKLPSSCTSISEEVEITVHAGRKYSEKFPGTAFAFDKQQWNVKPCAKVTWHFINEDEIRHQFMMHGLPKYLYKYGMFHLEVTGPKTISGTIIVPATDETYLVHCDISQHMEKGMKAQLVVGKGGKDIPSIPGLTPYNLTDTYEAEDLPKISDKTSDKTDKNLITMEITEFTNNTNLKNYGMLLIGILIGLLSVYLFKRVPFRKKND